MDVADRHVTIVECRPPWRADIGVEWTRFPIARLRYVKTTGVWSLYWRERNVRLNNLSVINPFGTVVQTIDIVNNPSALAVTPDGQTMYVTTLNTNALWAVPV